MVRRAQQGDLTAFQELYGQTREDVHRILYQLVGSNSEMEDLVQEVYVQLLRSLPSFRGEAKFSTFLYRVCGNVGLMHLRTRKRHPEDPVAEVPDTQAGPESDPERSALLRQAAALMQAVLDTLSPDKRLVFVYHDLLGMKPEEIAEATGAPSNTVRSRLNRAREAFTAELARRKGSG